MTNAQPTVLVIADDPDLRASVGRLLRSVGLETQLFGSISDFLKSDSPEGPTCLVLDVRLPGQSGLDFQRELVAANRQLPIIFITGHSDIPMSVQAMKGGAIEFLTKPFRGHCHAATDLRSFWSPGSQRDGEDQLRWIPVPAGDH